jgi:hypothetical protein
VKWNWVRFVAAVVFVAGWSPAVRAEEAKAQGHQESRRTFSTITLEGTALASTGDDDFQEFWDPGFGGELAVLTPVPYGFLELAAHPFANDPKQDDLPRIRTLGTYLGWGFDVSLPAHVILRAGARTGVFWMLYDETASTTGKDENEIAVGGRASLQYALTPALGIQAGARFVHVLTKKEMDFFFLGGGLAWTFTTPDWLRGFLE